MKNHRAFTLIEILIYTGLTAIVGTLFGGILVGITKIQTRQNVLTDVNQELRFSLQYIQQLIRASSVVDIPQGIQQTELKLRMRDETDPTQETPTRVSVGADNRI